MERGRMYATLGPNWKVPLRNSPRSRSYVYSPSGANPCHGCSEVGSVTIEGPLRRKTLLKEGRKPKLSSWTRFWITLSGSTLTFYGAKALRASERKHYKSSACKKVCVTGWMVVLPDDPARPNIFHLNDPDKGNVYKFQTGSRFSAIIWHKNLEEACRSCRPQIPTNLMSFE
nr:ras-specific guanine nucleotide-releasing factor RalGPS1-like [Salvelinus alpinus]